VDGKVIYTEGDPDHPINRGSLCSKGSSVYQLSANNPSRSEKPLYRAPNSSEWKEVSWDWALDKIAEKIYKTREQTFMFKNAKGQTVNRTEAIASVGSAAMDNEECYVYRKFLTALGLVYIEHQARI
jgi:formate dehydrogenase major subunit